MAGIPNQNNQYEEENRVPAGAVLAVMMQRPLPGCRNALTIRPWKDSILTRAGNGCKDNCHPACRFFYPDDG